MCPIKASHTKGQALRVMTEPPSKLTEQKRRTDQTTTVSLAVHARQGIMNNSWTEIFIVALLFLCRSESPLATLYSTSTMEHHHLDHCIMILNSEVSWPGCEHNSYASYPWFKLQGNQIFNGLSSRQYDETMKIVGNAILSTDLALYFKYVYCVLTINLCTL